VFQEVISTKQHKGAQLALLIIVPHAVETTIVILALLDFNAKHFLLMELHFKAANKFVVMVQDSHKSVTMEIKSMGTGAVRNAQSKADGPAVVEAALVKATVSMAHQQGPS
jgi:hypothetical protein